MCLEIETITSPFIKIIRNFGQHYPWLKSIFVNCNINLKICFVRMLAMGKRWFCWVGPRDLVPGWRRSLSSEASSTWTKSIFRSHRAIRGRIQKLYLEGKVLWFLNTSLVVFRFNPFGFQVQLLNIGGCSFQISNFFIKEPFEKRKCSIKIVYIYSIFHDFSSLWNRLFNPFFTM